MLMILDLLSLLVSTTNLCSSVLLWRVVSASSFIDMMCVLESVVASVINFS